MSLESFSLGFVTSCGVPPLPTDLLLIRKITATALRRSHAVPWGLPSLVVVWVKSPGLSLGGAGLVWGFESRGLSSCEGGSTPLLEHGLNN